MKTNKDIITEFVKATNEKDWDKALNLVHSDFVRYKMKYIVLLLLCSCSLKHKSNASKAESAKVSLLSPFEATFLEGDESVNRYKLKVYYQDGQVWADKLLPNYYYGKQTDSVWRVSLSDEQIELCNRFLKKARSLPKECPSQYTGVFFTGIVTQTDEISVDGVCDWGKISYPQLEAKLFEKQFLNLKTKRQVLEDSLLHSFQGRWYLTPFSGEPKHGDKLVLRKEPSVENKQCFWNFSPNYKFNSGCTTLLSMPYSEDYRFDIDEGDTSLHIEGGVTKDKNGYIGVANEGANFIIETFGKDKIVLNFLWR